MPRHLLKKQSPKHNVPKVLKSYATGGAVVVGFSPRDAELNLKEPVFIKFDELPVPFFIESVEAKGSRAIVKFEDVDSLRAAEELVGREVAFSPDGAEEGEADDILGRIVCNASGAVIGPVTEVLDYPGNLCIEVDYNGRRVILPLHEDLVVKVTGKKIWLSIPEGLLD